MGNYVSCVQLPSETPVETIKLIKSDGLVKIYLRHINVSDLILEFPKHLVCHSDSFYIGQKILALSENAKLQVRFSFQNISFNPSYPLSSLLHSLPSHLNPLHRVISQSTSF
uniref:Uncharacterized protein n=1 Tax=Nelumbo nucifera TaxID=4432 RepID=A0A822ZCI7_NELNU|nr:TPA_asm: hypothetical protein HUJ06_015478 [Nelumbo nucifera]